MDASGVIIQTSHLKIRGIRGPETFHDRVLRNPKVTAQASKSWRKKTEQDIQDENNRIYRIKTDRVGGSKGQRPGPIPAWAGQAQVIGVEENEGCKPDPIMRKMASGLQPSNVIYTIFPRACALGWYGAAPLALKDKKRSPEQLPHLLRNLLLSLCVFSHSTVDSSHLLRCPVSPSPLIWTRFLGR